MDDKRIFFAVESNNPFFRDKEGRNNRRGDVIVYFGTIYQLTPDFDTFIKRISFTLNTELICSFAHDAGFDGGEPCPIVGILKMGYDDQPIKKGFHPNI
jgi:predicted nucleotidyltransferase